MINEIQLTLRPSAAWQRGGPDVRHITIEVRTSDMPQTTCVEKLIHESELEPMIDIYMEHLTRELKAFLKQERKKRERPYSAIADLILAVDRHLLEQQEQENLENRKKDSE